MTPDIVERLLADTEAGKVLPESEDFENPVFTEGEAERAAAWIEANPQPNAFHLLMALRRGARGAYDGVPAATRAKVLAGALREHRPLNDFGYLDVGGSYDGPAAIALLESGEDAIAELRPLLDDTSRAPIDGSEEATLAKMYGYRKADFAFRYLSEILGRDAPFAASPTERDVAIDALRGELS